jgi:hypothetical protein
MFILNWRMLIVLFMEVGEYKVISYFLGEVAL